MNGASASSGRPTSTRSVDSQAARDAVIDSILEAETLYEVLQVKKTDDLSAAVLRKAYLKRSMQCHPDKSSHPRATEAFQRVAEAYDTLSDGLKRAQYDTRRQYERQPYNMSQHGDTVVMEMTAEQAFDMFAQAMDQYAEEHGIEHERQTTIFDHLASAFLFVDGWINPQVNRSAQRGNDSQGSDSQGNPATSQSASDSTGAGQNAATEEESNPPSRLQTWARHLATMGSIVSTASQIIRVQRERERQEEEAMRNGGNSTQDWSTYGSARE
eukprot:CAMPEP_0171503222 /NCGR_PEP_ID=MMETSP0958-20121227/10740_1 /TAXON_ID=87120 /ORGANISM="Aurantiochytrium limacinum, Strain ATCCMYA-1381" /LENGTH=270 /DNA_ID=CAMNT_0012038617 /DNA_START=89 /DNA_END=901 /DNA_ORIENTATION=+